MDNACYKLMFFIGILDMSALFINALETGILGIIGAVYCDYPLLIYTTGSMITVLWIAETSAEMMLAIDRCIELLRPQLAHAIFSGNKLRCLFALPICYASVMAMFTKSVLFSGIYLSWFFNPYFGYTDDFGEIYSNPMHTVHNSFIALGLSSIYIVFSAVLSWQTYTMSSSHQTISKTYIIVGTYAWVFTNGCPPLVYLLLNKRIRNDCANFCRAAFRFLRIGNNSVSNGSTAMAWMTPNYARNNANIRIREVANCPWDFRMKLGGSTIGESASASRVIGESTIGVVESCYRRVNHRRVGESCYRRVNHRLVNHRRVGESCYRRVNHRRRRVVLSASQPSASRVIGESTIG
ncbi:hypothetical protein niasHS_008382 [Heterodera schachtii]|uniref:7TM GPCR serpentine receptor class x (Srx) domain-containing protein n=1 Tax=Heterodera schachtii TaxID=97005 RepID=A0ABD2J022_HETSC